MVVAATKKQFALFISSLHGKIAKFLRHTIGAAGICYILLLYPLA
jgi:pumilio homology domain family member 6